MGATIGTWKVSFTLVRPLRVEPVPASATVEVTGMGTGPSPRRARTAAQRSWSTVPTTPPTARILLGPKAPSVAIVTALPTCALSPTGPRCSNWCPNPSADPSQTTVVVPAGARLTSP